MRIPQCTTSSSRVCTVKSLISDISHICMTPSWTRMSQTFGSLNLEERALTNYHIGLNLAHVCTYYVNNNKVLDKQRCCGVLYDTSNIRDSDSELRWAVVPFRMDPYLVISHTKHGAQNVPFSLYTVQSVRKRDSKSLAACGSLILFVTLSSLLFWYLSWSQMSAFLSTSAFIPTSPNSRSVDALGDILSCSLPEQKVGWGAL